MKAFASCKCTGDEPGWQFWLYTLDDKDEMADLSAKTKKALKDMLKLELEARR